MFCFPVLFHSVLDWVPSFSFSTHSFWFFGLCTFFFFFYSFFLVWISLSVLVLVRLLHWFGSVSVLLVRRLFLLVPRLRWSCAAFYARTKATTDMCWHQNCNGYDVTSISGHVHEKQWKKITVRERSDNRTVTHSSPNLSFFLSLFLSPPLLSTKSCCKGELSQNKGDNKRRADDTQKFRVMNNNRKMLSRTVRWRTSMTLASSLMSQSQCLLLH